MQKTEESRIFSAELDCLTKPDGSAKFSIRDTIQLCAVYGPGEVKVMKELAERASLSISYKNKSGIAGAQEKVLEYSIKGICDGAILTQLHPRTSINVIIQDLQSDGNQFACAVNCLCLALLDASIPLRYLFAAVRCGYLQNSNQIVYFPTVSQEKDCSVILTFVFDSLENDVVSIDSSGTLDKPIYESIVAAAKQFATDKILPYFKLITEKQI